VANDDEIREIRDRLEDVENWVEALRLLPERMSEVKGQTSRELGELTGKLEALSAQINAMMTTMNTRFNGVDKGVEKVASFKTAVTFASVVLVPIVVALIGGYIALHAQPVGVP
jgi:SNF family Na+-dependent transporter